MIILAECQHLIGVCPENVDILTCFKIAMCKIWVFYVKKNESFHYTCSLETQKIQRHQYLFQQELLQSS